MGQLRNWNFQNLDTQSDSLLRGNWPCWVQIWLWFWARPIPLLLFWLFLSKTWKKVRKTSEADHKSNTSLQSCIYYNMPWLCCRRNPPLPHHWWTWTLGLPIQVWNWSQLITDLNLIGNFPKLWRMFWLSKTSELNRLVDARFSRMVNSMAHDIHFAVYLKRMFNRVADDSNPFYATLSTLQDENIHGTLFSDLAHIGQIRRIRYSPILIFEFQSC